MAMTYAGVGLLLPTNEWIDWIAAIHPLSAVPVGGGGFNSLGGSATIDLPLPNDPVPPPVQLGTLCWPTGASRWATFHAIVGSTRLDEIRDEISSGGVGDLVLSDGNTGQEITAESMRLLPPLPLHQIEDNEQLYLITLVDQRWDWWLRSGSILTQPTTWANLYTTLSASLGITLTPTAVHANYGIPSDIWLQYRRPLPVLLDAVAEAVGQKVVVQLDGTVTTVSATAAQAASVAAFAQVRKTAGGTVDQDDIARWVPASVSVVTAASTEAGGNKTLTASSVTLASLSLTDYGVATGVSNNTVTVHRELCSPSVTVANFRTRVATDWYNWQLLTVDATLPGIWDWTVTGAEDRVEWRYENGILTTRLVRPSTIELPKGWVYWRAEPLIRVTDVTTGTGEYSRRYSVQEVEITDSGAARNLADTARSWTDVIEIENRLIPVSSQALPEEGVYPLHRSATGHLYFDADEGSYYPSGSGTESGSGDDSVGSPRRIVFYPEIQNCEYGLLAVYKAPLYQFGNGMISLGDYEFDRYEGCCECDDSGGGSGSGSGSGTSGGSIDEGDFGCDEYTVFDVTLERVLTKGDANSGVWEGGGYTLGGSYDGQGGYSWVLSDGEGCVWQGGDWDGTECRYFTPVPDSACADVPLVCCGYALSDPPDGGTLNSCCTTNPIPDTLFVSVTGGCTNTVTLTNVDTNTWSGTGTVGSCTVDFDLVCSSGSWTLAVVGTPGPGSRTYNSTSASCGPLLVTFSENPGDFVLCCALARVHFSVSETAPS